MARNCHLLGRLWARLRLLVESWRRPRLPLRDYEDDLARLGELSDRAHCDRTETERDRLARGATDRYRARAIDAAVRERGRG
jgi:hypothetical protein